MEKKLMMQKLIGRRVLKTAQEKAGKIIHMY